MLVGCGGGSGSSAKEAQLHDLLVSQSAKTPTPDAVDKFVGVIKKECGEDDTGLGYFVALSSRPVNELNAKAFDIWCPDRAGKYRELMAEQQ